MSRVGCVAAVLVPVALVCATAHPLGTLTTKGIPGPAATPRSTSSLTPTTVTALPDVTGAPGTFVADVTVTSRATDQGSGALVVLSARTGALLRWLTKPPPLVYDTVDQVTGSGWVYFTQTTSDRCDGSQVFRAPLAGGTAKPVVRGGTDYVVSTDGRFVAYTWARGTCPVPPAASLPEYLTVLDLETGRSHTLTVADQPTSMQPPGIGQLSWSPDDRHLAGGISETAAISTVAILSPFDQSNVFDGEQLPPCTLSSKGCWEGGPSYGTNGSLSYVYMKFAPTPPRALGIARWQDGDVRTVGTFRGSLICSFDPAGSALLSVVYPNYSTSGYFDLVEWVAGRTYTRKVSAPWVRQLPIAGISWG